jgi:hypothetical protein
MLIVARRHFRSFFGSSLRSPPGFHRGRKLRAAFRREIQFSLRFPGATPFLRVGLLR